MIFRSTPSHFSWRGKDLQNVSENWRIHSTSDHAFTFGGQELQRFTLPDTCKRFKFVVTMAFFSKMKSFYRSHVITISASSHVAQVRVQRHPWAEAAEIWESWTRENGRKCRVGDICLLTVAGWWFGTCFPYVFHIGNSHPNWLIFFGGFETTNRWWI